MSVVKVTGLHDLEVFDVTALMPQARLVAHITYGVKGTDIADAAYEVVNVEGHTLRQLGSHRQIRLPKAVVRKDRP